MLDSHRSRQVWMIATLALVAWLAPTPAQAQVSTVVAEGTVQDVAGALQTGVLEVDGTLRAAGPGDLTIHADAIHVGPSGAIEAFPGMDGAGASAGEAYGAAGLDGGSITLIANEVVVDSGGWILGGAGGAGGDAVGDHFALGGHGGRGGDVVFVAPVVRIDG